jgi:organic radical activating enzyme
VTPDRSDWLLVSEQFYTLQGEGPSAGQPAYFIRLGGCNQHCSFCDTPYTWVFDERHRKQHIDGKAYDPKQQLKRKSVDQVYNELRDECPRLVVITGGEPILQLPGVSKLISTVNEEIFGPAFEIETAGTVDPGELAMYDNVQFNVSPKLASSGNELELRRNLPVLKRFVSECNAVFKFVIINEQDIAEVEELTSELAIHPERIWLMPEGTDPVAIQDGLRRLADVAISHDWNLTSRMHVVIWGNKRGH